MEKDKNSKEKEIQEKLNRLNRNINKCEEVRKRMEQVIAKYNDAIEGVELLRQTYESLIATHNNLINQFIEKTNE